ncbi:hypothetical protein E2C01_024604 [Portunus trituberculatus]|uniref:Uncharacterized protein n=1 Tax=Portunus trituberculatus TaxID=210409 RepID=A0A5B7ECT1_PORTR|nr:hypothetical protein [Portunus trituberculatus]
MNCINAASSEVESLEARLTTAERKGDEEVVRGGGEGRESEAGGGEQRARHGDSAEPELLGERGRYRARQPPGHHSTATVVEDAPHCNSCGKNRIPEELPSIVIIIYNWERKTRQDRAKQAGRSEARESKTGEQQHQQEEKEDEEEAAAGKRHLQQLRMASVGTIEPTYIINSGRRRNTAERLTEAETDAATPASLLRATMEDQEERGGGEGRGEDGGRGDAQDVYRDGGRRDEIIR